MIETRAKPRAAQVSSIARESLAFTTAQLRNLAIAEAMFAGHEDHDFELLSAEERAGVPFDLLVEVHPSKLVFHQPEVEAPKVLAKASGISLQGPVTVTPVMGLHAGVKHQFFLVSDGNHALVSQFTLTSVAAVESVLVKVQDDEALRRYWGGEEIERSLIELNRTKGALPRVVARFSEQS